MPNSLKYSCHIIQKIVKAKNQSIGSLFLTSPQIDAVCFHLLLFVYFLVYIFNYSDWSWGDWFKGGALGYCGGSSALSAWLDLELPRRHTFQCVYVNLQDAELRREGPP